MKQGCPATIKFRLSEDYQKLVVSYVNLDYNHAVGKVDIKGMVIACLFTNVLQKIYTLLPRQRKLNSAEKDEAKSCRK